MTLTLKELTLDNWREKWTDKCELYHDADDGIDFMEDLLILQKNSLKDEAVKRIEELSIRQNHLYADGLDEAKEVIHNL